MKIEKLKKGNQLLNEIDYCDQSLNHIVLNHLLSFRYDTTRDCIESHDSMYCPKWLLEVIRTAIMDYREKCRKEFESL